MTGWLNYQVWWWRNTENERLSFQRQVSESSFTLVAVKMPYERRVDGDETGKVRKCEKRGRPGENPLT
mgnify:CR=1 FL=1